MRLGIAIARKEGQGVWTKRRVEGRDGVLDVYRA